MGFQVNGNTFIDNTGSAIFNANTSVANNFSVQLTPFASRESTSPMQGTVAGFNSGGHDGSSPPVETNVIDKFPFANELTAVDHGDLTAARRQMGGQSSDTQGFVSGGYYAPVSPTTVNIIEKFTFATASNATDHGDLTQGGRRLSASQSSSVSGYTSGGLAPPAVGPPANVNTVDKFPFSSDSGASDVGDLAVTRRNLAGQSSGTDGYSTGGFLPPASFFNTIDKFPFASDTNATDIADMTQARSNVSGQSSKIHGYVSGGYNPPVVLDTIDKFSFVTDSDATDVGNLTSGKYLTQGQNSREHGYVSGGRTPSLSLAMIERFSFAVDSDASDVGNLTQARGQGAGAQD